MSACRDEQVNCGITEGACASLSVCTNYGVADGEGLDDHEWHHVRVERDASAGRLLLAIDGVVAAESDAPPTGLVANEEPLCIGAFADGSRSFAGEIEGVRIELL